MRHCCIIIVLDDIIMVICLDFFRELARDACSAGRRGRDFASRSCYRAIASPEPLKVKIQIINPRYTFSIQSTISVPHSPRRNEVKFSYSYRNWAISTVLLIHCEWNASTRARPSRTRARCWATHNSALSSQIKLASCLHFINRACSRGWVESVVWRRRQSLTGRC